MQDRKVQGVNLEKQEQRREKDIWQHLASKLGAAAQCP